MPSTRACVCGLRQPRVSRSSSPPSKDRRGEDFAAAAGGKPADRARHGSGRGARGGWAVARDPARRNLCAPRRVRLRQVDGRAVDHAAPARCRPHHRRQRAPRGRGTARGAGSGDARRARRAHRHDLPGAGDEPEPGDDRRRADRRSDRAPRRARRRRRRGTRAGDARCGANSGRRAPLRRVSVPALGRDEAARHDRDGARLQAESAARGRTHHGARRDHPGAGTRPAARAAARERHGDPAHHPRSRSGCRDGPSGRRDVRGPRGRDGRARGVLSRAPAPILAEAFRLAPRAWQAWRRSRRDPRERAAAYAALRGMPVRRALRARVGAVPRRSARVARPRCGPWRALPPVWRCSDGPSRP